MNETRKSIMPVVVGIALTAVLLVFLAYAASKRRAEIDAVPRLTLLSPTEGASVTLPLIVRFTSTVPLELQSMGWTAASHHLHAWLDNTQLMPAAKDIHKIDGNTYEWRIDQTPHGDQMQFRLSWADMKHNPIPEGASRQITLSIR
ncbi:MAG TPA: hypothetical protein VM100_06880 [Longimicrobiales bacterium]|nr:hypothetical protein [Longimicrobiales bacterium]